MYFSVDKFEGDLAVLTDEEGKPLTVAVQMLPAGVKQGEMLLYKEKKFFAAPEKTTERRKQVADTLALLLKKNKE